MVRSPENVWYFEAGSAPFYEVLDFAGPILSKRRPSPGWSIPECLQIGDQEPAMVLECDFWRQPMYEENKQLAQRWFEEVWNRGRESAIDELLAEDGIAFGLGESGTPVHAPEQLKPFVRNLLEAFPDLHITIEDMVAEADKVVVRFSATGSHQGNGLGFPPTGRPMSVTGMTILQISNGKLRHGWNNWDQLGMMQQLGVAPGEVRVDQFLKRTA
jgi:steroid delta-isomerase-like uncharacterized protein